MKLVFARKGNLLSSHAIELGGIGDVLSRFVDSSRHAIAHFRRV
jgi:hypothetical protein